jgi:hypothetical protein
MWRPVRVTQYLNESNATENLHKLKVLNGLYRKGTQNSCPHNQFKHTKNNLSNNHTLKV